MTYLEMILLIAERKEKIISDHISAIQTEKHLYTRLANGNWQDEEALPRASTLTLATPDPPKEKKKK